ncbi:23S rRNA pseudouridine2605 synthase [Ancylobacter polymorphus]|uniref:Pseudouridine synthase n=2 Tax=Ancylobacter polymorphus TaxID=223390 RepID=A0ABU0B835_9HYPH|nr:pseudouridine synthase [Ancylobacter polymorphus]MDQ0301993.1 23S rRNA pseudouridine2605 synthase [Ancylobacter polymorphus]
MPKNTPPRKEHNRVPRPARPAAPEEAGPREAERVAKVVARAGLGSRREIEEWILAGRVAVNGEVLESPARTVTAEDEITVDGVKLPDRERTRLFLYHKPKGVVTTNYDPEGRPTLFEILPPGLPRLVSVGRLDLNTEGLILLTNDGGLSRVLELPETGWLRRYRVRAKGDITQDKLDALIAGVTVDGVQYGPIEAVLDRVQGANVWLTLALREGKNREVRNVLGSLGLDVNRLIRLSYGPFQLGELAQGEAEEVRTRVLADQLGEALAKQAGADFEGPLFNHAEDEAPKRPAKPGKARYAKPEGAEDRHRRLPIDTEPGEGKSVTAGVVADRKGRKVLVQRVRSTEPVPEPAPARARRDEERASVRTGTRPGAAVGERGGERTFRKRPERAGEADGAVEREERPFRERPARAGAKSRDRKVGGPRPARPRVEREGEAGERSERPFRSRDEGGDRAPRGERPARPFRERGERPQRSEGSERGERPFRGAGSDRPYSGRVKSEQTRSFRPRTEGDERPPRRERPEGDRPFRERAPRPEGERPARSFRPRPEGQERPARRERPEGDRPFRERAPRPEGARPFRSRDDRPARDDRPPREDRGDRAPRGDRPARPFGERPAGGAGKSYGAKNFGAKNFADRPEGRSGGGKPTSGKPGGRPAGGKSFGGKPSGGRPTGGKPSGGRPAGGKPSGGKPGGGRPPRSPRG